MAVKEGSADTIAVTADNVIIADTVEVDTLQVDSIVDHTGEEYMGLVFDREEIFDARPVLDSGGMSWVYLAMATGFVIVALRFRNSPGYLKAMISDLTETRERTNMFDNTVRETSILVMMNIMWVACMGIFLWGSLPTVTRYFGISGDFTIKPAMGILVCTACVAIYDLLLMLAYWIVGNVFTDGRRSELWLKGAAASAGLETIILFPMAMLMLARPEWTYVLLMIAATVFVIGKCVFLLKGFRIFFTQFSSWMLFLYYILSLEIVPPVLLYVATIFALEWV